METKKKYTYTFNNICEQCGKEWKAKKKTNKLCSQICISASNSAKKTKHTPEFIAKIRTMRLSGLTSKEIGGEVGMTEASVKTLMSSNGIILPTELANKNMTRRWDGHNPWIDGTKLKCSTCEEIKEKEEFNLRESTASGHTTICSSCVNKYNTNYYKENAEEIKENVKIYQEEHKEEISEKNREYYQKNKEAAKERASMFAAANPEKRKEYEKKWRRANQKHRNGKCQERRLKLSQAMPKNLSQECKDKMVKIYEDCPDGFNVDHEIPINGEIVSGLHVPWNLRYLESSPNESKGNKLILDMAIGPCIQYLIRKNLEEQDRGDGKTFDLSLSDIVLNNEQYDSLIHKPFIERYEWLGTIGRNPGWTFTARYNGDLVGVILISVPPSYMKGNIDVQAIIQRGACSSWAPKNLNSKLVMFACNWMVKNTKKRVFTCYSDFDAGEIGTIYQACNFKYMGNHFGSRHSYILSEEKTVGSRYFTQISNMKKWAKELGIVWQKEWLKDRKTKNISTIPKDVYKKLTDYAKEKMLKCERIDESQKGKYILILGRSKKERKFWETHFNINTYPYPKRTKEELPNYKENFNSSLGC